MHDSALRVTSLILHVQAHTVVYHPAYIAYYRWYGQDTHDFGGNFVLDMCMRFGGGKR